MILVCLLLMRPLVALWNRNAVTNAGIEACELRAQSKDRDDNCQSHANENERVLCQTLGRLARRRAPEEVARWPDHVVVQSTGPVSSICGALLSSTFELDEFVIRAWKIVCASTASSHLPLADLLFAGLPPR